MNLQINAKAGGPLGLDELTTYKWLGIGNEQIRTKKTMKTLLKAGVLLCLLFFNASSYSQFITKIAPKIGGTPPPLQFSQMVQGPRAFSI